MAGGKGDSLHDGDRVTRSEAYDKRCCLYCGVPGSQLYRLKDGRLFSSCDPCARGSCIETLNGAEAVEWPAGKGTVGVGAAVHAEFDGLPVDACGPLTGGGAV